MIPTRQIDEAVTILNDGGVGVLPTDTVYGLVARASDAKAVGRFYALKHREHKPGTVVAASIEQLMQLGVPGRHLKRVTQWWPNPLSVEISLGQDLAYLHQDTGRQAFRVVADEQLRAVLEQTGPLVTSSANQPGEPGATNLSEAQEYFKNKVDFYVDGGDLSGRAPSTIIRVVADEIEVIRQGAVEIDQSGMRYITPSKAGCVFCRSNGRLKGEIIAAADGGFLIRAQSNPGDFLIVPDTHVETLAELPDTWWADVKELLIQVPDLLPDYNISINIGPVAGQTVKHLHFWVIPRSANDSASGKGFARLIEEAGQ
ncbi:MAG TPA: Sua5/YciO/YrdC/YwlC family protein [Candidatus Saccharimonadia bacterium]|jgi:L-threonylcarbamoyladenylate synthase|nr:Sua5/YciO/YrdC/YwlC family protein [Candidatus Saccharimonadia bacterium]